MKKLADFYRQTLLHRAENFLKSRQTVIVSPSPDGDRSIRIRKRGPLRVIGAISFTDDNTRESLQARLGLINLPPVSRQLSALIAHRPDGKISVSVAANTPQGRLFLDPVLFEGQNSRGQAWSHALSSRTLLGDILDLT